MNDVDQRLATRIAQTIAIQAMELSPCERSGLIQREAEDWRSYYQQALSDPRALTYAEAFADRIEWLTDALVSTIEVSGGTLGRA